MCGIAGFCNIGLNFLDNKQLWEKILNDMNKAQKHRGPNDEGIFIKGSCGLAHVRLSIRDLKNGIQPMSKNFDGKRYTIVYNGEIYNTKELKEELEQKGAIFKTTSDTEIILMGHLIFKENFVKKLNGIFSYAIWDEYKKELTLFRDRLGIKPLFYTLCEGFLVFASEIKGIFQYPAVKKQLDKEGLCEIFGLGPAKTQGKGVFKDVFELLPGHFLKINKTSIKQVKYWELKAKMHLDSFQKTVSKTEFLLKDSIKRQLVSDIPVCTFLSGGVDSSLVSAIAALELKKKGLNLDSFSFDYIDNAKYFKSNSFQPSQDRPFVEKMVEFLKTNHHFLECDSDDLIENLYTTVDARDLPCMADVESSLLYFCKKVSKSNRVVLTGETADEIFGGYPWFHRPEMLYCDNFPWALNVKHRNILLKDEVIKQLQIEEYVKMAYKETINETPKLYGETKKEARRREISFLNLKWFMNTLLDRMDRTSMHCGLEARVPFADHRIVEYLFNVPWEFKACGGIIKGLLRKAGEKYLPKEILYRKKSPYPKTYNPDYESKLKKILLEVIEDNNSPICNFISKKKVYKFLNIKSNYNTPWYGQLMAGPQMIAYILQVNYWLKKYDIKLV